MKFHFDEVSYSGQVVSKSISWNLGSQTSINSDGGGELNKKFNGLAFFELINSKLSGYSDEASVEKRIIDKVEFIVTAGNEDLNIYMDVNEPATGVVTERPSFTNVSFPHFSAPKYTTPILLDDYKSGQINLLVDRNILRGEGNLWDI